MGFLPFDLSPCQRPKWRGDLSQNRGKCPVEVNIYYLIVNRTKPPFLTQVSTLSFMATSLCISGFKAQGTSICALSTKGILRILTWSVSRISVTYGLNSAIIHGIYDILNYSQFLLIWLKLRAA